MIGHSPTMIGYSPTRFVLYQLSKNLNRPFFVDFLTHLSIRYTDKGGTLDEEEGEVSIKKISSLLVLTK